MNFGPEQPVNFGAQSTQEPEAASQQSAPPEQADQPTQVPETAATGPSTPAPEQSSCPKRAAEAEAAHEPKRNREELNQFSKRKANSAANGSLESGSSPVASEDQARPFEGTFGSGQGERRVAPMKTRRAEPSAPMGVNPFAALHQTASGASASTGPSPVLQPQPDVSNAPETMATHASEASAPDTMITGADEVPEQQPTPTTDLNEAEGCWDQVDAAVAPESAQQALEKAGQDLEKAREDTREALRKDEEASE
jgi:hypothetical protein